MTDFRQVWRLHAYSGGTVRDSHPVFYSPVGLLPLPQALKRNIYLTIEYHFELILSRGKGCAAQSDNLLYTMLLKKVKKILDKSPANPVKGCAAWLNTELLWIHLKPIRTATGRHHLPASEIPKPDSKVRNIPAWDMQWRRRPVQDMRRMQHSEKVPREWTRS